VAPGFRATRYARKRHSEEQIGRILRDAEVSDLSSAEVAKKHGVSEATLFRWKRKYGGMDVSEARRLKELETENARPLCANVSGLCDGIDWALRSDSPKLRALIRADAELCHDPEHCAKAYSKVYRELLRHLPVTVLTEPEHVRASWHLFPVLLEPDEGAPPRADVFSGMRAAGIGVNVLYRPLHLHTTFRTSGSEQQFPVAEDAYSRLLSLPMWHGLRDDELERVIAALAKVASGASAA
jgi:hypothetical protein